MTLCGKNLEEADLFSKVPLENVSARKRSCLRTSLPAIAPPRTFHSSGGVTKLTKANPPACSAKLEDAEGDVAICEKWKKHYESLFQSSRSLVKLTNLCPPHVSLVTPALVAEACKSLGRNKA